MVKRIIVFVITISMLISAVSGCKKDEVTDTITKNDGQQVSVDSNDEELEPITFTYFSVDTNAAQGWDDFNGEVSKEITRQTGVTLDAEFVVGDPKQKLALMAASETYPDFLYALEFSNIIIDAGGFVKLDDYIDQYGPNIKNLYGNYYKRLRWNNEDPSIYMLGLPEVNRVIFTPECGFQLQHDVVKELGYPKMETLQDFENAIRAYKEKYPEIDGKPTLGLSLLAEDWRLKITVTNPAAMSTGAPNDGEWYYDEETGKASLHIKRPEEKEYFRWLNHMYNEGLLDPESFTQNFDIYQTKISEGRVLALADSGWQYGQAETSLIAAGKPERTYSMFPLVLEEGMKYPILRDEGYAGGYGVGITENCEDKERAVQFLDWLCTDEAQVLINWGIKGTHYDVVDGKRTMKPDVYDRWTTDPNFTKETGFGMLSWPWPGYGEGALDPTGDYYRPTFTETIIDGYSAIEKEVLSQYGATMWKDIYPGPEEFSPSPYGALWRITIPTDNEASVIFRKYDEVVARRVAQSVLTSPEEFDAIWDEFMQELDDIGCDLLEEEFTKLVQEKIALWNQ